MGLTSENATDMVMPVAPMNGGFPAASGSWDNGNGWWIILLFILLASGNWGGYGSSNGQPIIVNDSAAGSSVQRGFDQAEIIGGLSGIQASVNGISTQLCNSFANVETAATARQMANMQQLFGLSTQFADCCCENRLGTADLKYTIATENCADRYEAAQNTRDIIENANRNNQAILDKLCSLELDAKNDRIADLERQLTAANLSASQTAQTSRILADNAAQTVALEQYLNPTPIPAYTVQNPNCCTNACGVNCGCGI